ncbi:MAG: hypothetical protein LBU85_12950, partial [Treponema sp.]|nr:hypothetical protein [Treponema sp.]
SIATGITFPADTGASLISATGDFPSGYQFLLVFSIAEIKNVKKGKFPYILKNTRIYPQADK